MEVNKISSHPLLCASSVSLSTCPSELRPFSNFLYIATKCKVSLLFATFDYHLQIVIKCLYQPGKVRRVKVICVRGHQ